MTNQNPQLVILGLLAEDKETIPYRKSLRGITSSVTATILLQQMIFRAKQSGWKPFYKFIEPCEHHMYRDGDSWTEELGFSKKEFTTALSKIGTKTLANSDKAEIMEPTPGESIEDKAKRLIIYWTDGNRVTWYMLNSDLICDLLSHLHLNDQSAFSPNDDTTLNDQSAFTKVTNGNLPKLPIDTYIYRNTENTRDNNREGREVDQGSRVDVPPAAESAAPSPWDELQNIPSEPVGEEFKPLVKAKPLQTTPRLKPNAWQAKSAPKPEPDPRDNHDAGSKITADQFRALTDTVLAITGKTALAKDPGDRFTLKDAQEVAAFFARNGRADVAQVRKVADEWQAENAWRWHGQSRPGRPTNRDLKDFLSSQLEAKMEPPKPDYVLVFREAPSPWGAD